jgi:8-oxo-dGTP diphosphatase|tara:strand:+ start:581 stop:979 length:399 start_codon:yes stop_codon:yes gene_type:complete
MKKIEVAAAIIKKNDLFLCCQRKKNKLTYLSEKWEFPGGKVEQGEGRKQAVTREIKEELDMNIKVDDLLITVNHKYPDFQITMHCFYCHCDSNELILKEHIKFKWLPLEDLKSLDWAAADLPVVNKLCNNER